MYTKDDLFPGEMLVLVYGHDLLKICLSILLFPGVGIFLEIGQCTQIPTENNEQMPDHDDDMIQLELRILPCHLLLVRICASTNLIVIIIFQTASMTASNRIVHIHCSHPLNVSSLHIHHGTSFNQTLSMSSCKKHLHVEVCSGTVLS
jgi:hypothetical protein